MCGAISTNMWVWYSIATPDTFSADVSMFFSRDLARLNLQWGLFRILSKNDCSTTTQQR